MRKQAGLSLIELMIAITLGLILMAGVIQVFLSSRVTFATQQAMSRVQETGRLAVEFMARDIRMAGYMGCTSRSGLSLTQQVMWQDSTETLRRASKGLPLCLGVSICLLPRLQGPIY
ncbi:hypothetical protein CBR65_09340 [Cellvibrio sp. PSBB006]|nr:hypothetical protein CBR65_09340 [Cellvibrio sp. PSBB006]